MKKVLVAGATGYLGKHIVNELKSRGYWVRVLIRKESQKKLKQWVEPPKREVQISRSTLTKE